MKSKKITSPLYLKCFRKILATSLLPITVLLPLATSVSAGYVDSSNIKGITPMFRNDERDWWGGGGAYIPPQSPSNISTSYNSFMSQNISEIEHKTNEIENLISIHRFEVAKRRLDELFKRIDKLKLALYNFREKIMSIYPSKEHYILFDKWMEWTSIVDDLDLRAFQLKFRHFDHLDHE